LGFDIRAKPFDFGRAAATHWAREIRPKVMEVA
jgi:hypothetical protein